MNAGAAELAADALRLVDAEPARAFALAGEAVRLARPTGEHLTTAVAERARGLAALHLAHVDTSVEHLSAAVAAARRAGSSRLLGEARMSLAGAFVRRGEPRRAQRVVEQAVQNLTGLERARALAQRGAIAQQLGRLDDALADYREALPLLRAAGDSVWVQRVVSNRGVLRVYRSELDAAASDLDGAEKLCRELELDLQLAFCQENLGFVDTRRGDVPGALRWFDAAELTYRRLGASVGSLLVDRCELLLSVRLAREARTAAEQAVAELARARRRLQLAEAQLLLARAALLDGDPDRALQAATSAGRTFARQQRPSRAALARYTAVEARLARPGGGAPRLPTVVALADQLGRDGSAAAELEARLLAAQLAWAAGRDAVADQQLAKAARGRHRGPAAHRAQAWYAEALRRAHRRQRRGTTHAIRTGLRILDEYHATLGASDLRAYACGQRQDLTDLGLRGALEAGSARRALAWVERGRASTLLARSVRPPDDPALALLLAQLRATVAELESARRGGQAATAARRRQLTLEATIRDHTRRRPATDGDGARLPPEALPAALAERLDEAALVEYVEFDGFLHAIVVVDGRVRMRHLCRRHSGPAALRAGSVRPAPLGAGAPAGTDRARDAPAVQRRPAG